MRRRLVAIGLGVFVACAPFGTDPTAAPSGDDDDDAVAEAGEPRADAARADPDASPADGADGGTLNAKAQAYATLVRTHTPKAYWRCSEGVNASRTEDEEGSFPAVFTGSPPARIAVGKGLFPGTNACELTGVAHQLATAGELPLFVPDFTLEMWFNLRSGPDLTFFRHLFEHSEGQNSASRAYGIFLHQNADGSGIHSEYYIGGIKAHHLAHAAAPALNVWHHVVATSADGLWIDGIKSQLTEIADGFPSVTQTFAFGAKGNDNDPSVDGFITEVAVYGYKLADEQIRAHYDAGKP